MNENNLHEYQRYGVNFIIDHPYCGLFLDCGLGKTVTAIKIAEAKERPVLIIAPNVLCKQWAEEIEDKKEKDWETVVCTSKTKNTKRFKEAFARLCLEE